MNDGNPIEYRKTILEKIKDLRSNKSNKSSSKINKINVSPLADYRNKYG